MPVKVTRLVRGGKYVAEVMVESIPDNGAWGPYLSLEDALKLERVRAALKAGDVKAALRDAKVYEAKVVAPLESRDDEESGVDHIGEAGLECGRKTIP